LRRPINSWREKELVDAVLNLINELGIDRYPTLREFKRHGLYGAAHTIQVRWGGHGRFSRKVGYPRTTVIRPRGVAEMEQAVLQLAQQLSLSRYPTQREFNENGYGGIYQAIDRLTEGHAGLARRLGLTRSTSKGRWDRRETRYAVVRELVERLGIDRYPTRQEFLAAGMNGAYQAIAKHLGGHDACARALGLTRVDRRRYTDEDLIRLVRSLVVQLDLARYPTQREFLENQLSGVESTIRKGLGHNSFAQMLGLPRARDMASARLAGRRTHTTGP
jgi:hypothetical protein